MTKSTIITGCGCISAAGNSCLEAIRTIKSGVINNTITSDYFFPELFAAPCFFVNKDDGELIQQLPYELTGLQPNRTILLALTAVAEGLAQAGISLTELQGKRVGIALGTTVGCTFHNEPFYIDWSNKRAPDTSLLENYFQSNLAQRLQNVLGLSGPRMVITNACASGTDAIGVAKSWLENDLCDLCIAGGSDELSRVACHGFKSLMLVSQDSCKPFDAKRKGLNLGEGAGIMILEREDGRITGSGNILGRVRGYGAAGDAHHPTAPHPEGKGLQQAINMALAEAHYTSENIDLINGHGTGTPANDKAETMAVSQQGFIADRTPLVSTKGLTGHTLGAAGGIEAVFTLLAVNDGKVYGTAGCETVDPAFFYPTLIQGQSQLLGGNLAISQSLAFGGGNSALVLEGER